MPPLEILSPLSFPIHSCLVCAGVNPLLPLAMIYHRGVTVRRTVWQTHRHRRTDNLRWL